MNEPLEAPSHTSRTEWEKQHKTREITAAEWEIQRGTFTQLYLDGLDLTKVRRIMAEKHDFYANEAQSKKKIKKWGLGKNLKKEVVAAMLRIRAQREFLHGKSTNFEYRGRSVEEDKLQRSRKRLDLVNPSGEELNSLEATTPLHLKYFTPSPGICVSGTSSENHYQGDADNEFLPEILADVVSTLKSQGEGLFCGRHRDICAHTVDPAQCNEFLPEYFSGILADVSTLKSQRGRYRDIYSGNEFIGGPTVDPAQRNMPDAAEITQPKEEAGGEIKQSLSDLEWKDPIRGDTSTIGSWIREDIVLSGSIFSFGSQSLCSSSHLGQGIGFSCCGIPLPSIDILLEHYEGNHSQQKGSGAQDATALTSSELDAEVMELEVPLEAMELEVPLAAMELSPGEQELGLNRRLLRIGLLEEIASKMRGEVGPYVAGEDQPLEEEMGWRKVRIDGLLELLGTLF